MITSIARTARFALLLAAGFALGAVAITTTSASSGKNGLLQTLGISSPQTNGPVLASSCVPNEDTSDDVYFVSCGGFF